VRTHLRLLRLLTVLVVVVAALAAVAARPQAGLAFSQSPAPIFINEIHYDNLGADSGEFVEVAGPAGTDLTGWSLVLYNGPNPYGTAAALPSPIPDLGGGFGVVVVNYPSNGIQNGTADGVALVNATTVVQLLSYEGFFTAASGPASGLISTDIGVAESDTTPAGFSLQLGGTGSSYQTFSWRGADTATPGAFNIGQNFGGGGPPVDPPTGCGAADTPISQVQGAGAASPRAGQSVTVQGVVTASFAGLRGFYLQEEAADRDANPVTSEGLFVFTSSPPSITVGEAVQVSGTVAEFPTNSSRSVTQLTGPTIVACGPGEAVAPTDVALPLASDTALEAVEGMLVRLPQELFIAEYFNYDRFGELVLGLPLPGTDRFYTPTSIVAPGDAANDLAEQYALRRITLDDGSTASAPASLPHPNGEPFSASNRFRGGDTVTGVVGVMDQSFGLYRVHTVQPGSYSVKNPRPAAPPALAGLRVGAYNVLNYFISIDAGGAGSDICGPANNLDCRGADSAAEFQRQRAKLLQALAALNADVLGLIELENSAGADPLGDATRGIVPGLNGLLGAGSYAAIDTGLIGTDAIRVGIIYKPGAVTPVGAHQILDQSDDPRFDSARNRPSLAQSFRVNATGEVFTVVVNHLKSKGSDCDAAGDPDTGDGQGNCNLTRTRAAAALMDWLASDPTGSGDPDVLILGDLNAYAQEDPVRAILAGADDAAGTPDDYTNLIARFGGELAYSYVFDGQAGYLDHALASASLNAKVSGAAEWHLNADEPDLFDYNDTVQDPGESASERRGLDVTDTVSPARTSDHDPVLVGIGGTRLYLPLIRR
jgi:uncharacterized protein